MTTALTAANVVSETSAPSTYTIPEINFDAFRNAFAKIARRAAKLGFDAPTYDVVETFMVPVKKGSNTLRKYFKVAISGNGPKIENWTFLGTLDHVAVPGSVIVKTVPGKVIPEQFFNAAPICDHCNTKRLRNATYVLQHDNGEYKLVGSSCARDFIGYDVSSMFNYLQFLADFADNAEEDFGSFDGGGEYYYNAMRILAVTAAIIKKEGWISRTNAKENFDVQATADKVLDYFNPPKFNRDDHNAWVQSLDTNNPVYAEIAEKAVSWLAEQDATGNEYLHNLKTLADQEAIGARMFGYWTSLVAAYNRAQERAKAASAAPVKNEYVGELKKRLPLTLTLKGVRTTEGYYGYTYIHNFVDAEGHSFVWFASNDNLDLEEGNTYNVKGTVKKHQEFRGIKQTVLNRVALVK